MPTAAATAREKPPATDGASSTPRGLLQRPPPLTPRAGTSGSARRTRAAPAARAKDAHALAYSESGPAEDTGRGTDADATSDVAETAGRTPCDAADTRRGSAFRGGDAGRLGTANVTVPGGIERDEDDARISCGRG